MLESTLISPSFLDVSHPPTAWQSYHYTDGGHTYIPVQYDPAGGPENRPSIWVNDLMWTIDTPEQPHSILALIYYRDWCFDGPLNLSRAKISCRLRGDNLQLHGAKCYFWIVSYTPRVTRWHYI
ncbi:MAG: hypothetical protein Q8J76_01265, partial [Desulfobulbaceae bacterium]|nr:hypothetical protein [Desulfobulbaceae bacterium]